MNEQVRIVTFETYYDHSLAYIILSRLKANRVACFIADDNALQLRPYFTEALGGIKIKVFEMDVDNCLAILSEDPEPLEQATDEPDAPGEICCPYCGSDNVRYGGAIEFKFHWPSLLLSLFFFVPLYFRNAWHCFNCHRDGEEKIRFTLIFLNLG
jgi:hypothetical protein